jgi:hypothetical protein
MTRDEIMKMEACAELDALIAEKVMGWKRYRTAKREMYWLDNPAKRVMPRGPGVFETTDNIPPFDDAYDHVPPFSTEIAPAWEVVEKLGLSVLKVQDGWQARKHVSMSDETSSNGETAPLAICRCALLAVTHQPEPAHDRR